MTKRSKASEIQESIRHILFYDWDPIGINDLAPNDEYDTYIAGVYGLLVSGASQAEISEHLRQVEITQIEVVSNSKRRKMVAEKLKTLNVSLID